MRRFSLLSTIFKRKKKIYGLIEYQFSGNFRYEQTRPVKDKIIFISNSKQKKTWYYHAPFKKGGQGDLLLNPMQGKFPLSRFFDALTRGLNNNQRSSA